MKHIIIEGGDRLGKNTIIKSLCDYYDYNNVTIRHFDKPPTGMSPKETTKFQYEVFYKEMLFVDHIREHINGDEWGYHDNVVIWNRGHSGEYVYSQLFRGISKKDAAFKLKTFEERNLYSNQYLITLTAAPNFFMSQDDGLSISANIDDKAKELQLFKEAHALSLIKNKKLIKVDSHDSFKDKDVIFNSVLDFINNKQ